MDKLRERSRRRFRSTTRQAGKAGEHGVSFLEPHIGDLAAVPGVQRNAARLKFPGSSIKRGTISRASAGPTKSSSAAAARASSGCRGSRARRRRP